MRQQQHFNSISFAWGAALALLLAVFCCLFLGTRIYALTAEISQSYVATSGLQPGAIVSLNDANSKQVEVATSDNSDKLAGVLIGSQNSAVALNTSVQTVQVATSGRAIALVSNINGNIKAGDTLSLSPVAGVAGKTVVGSRVIGVAQQDFTANSKNVSFQKIKDKYGEYQNIAFGTIPVVVGIGSKIDPAKTVTHGGILGWFEVLAGRNVSSLRLIICAFIAAVMLVILFIIIFSSIQSTIYGVSRNPFAKVSIFEALAKVMVMALIVATLAMSLIYVILRI